MDVALCRKRSLELDQDSEVKVAYSSNNSSYRRYNGVYVRVCELQQGEDSGGWYYTPSKCSAVLAARRLVEKCLNILLVVTWKHKNYGELRGNYHSRVLVLLDFRTRVIMLQHSAQS